MKRTKTIKVDSIEKESAIIEAGKKWEKSLVGKNCKVCDSILYYKNK